MNKLEYIVIGSENCTRCEVVKTSMEKKNISFKYEDINDINEDDKILYINLASERFITTLPLIFSIDGEMMITFEEFLELEMERE